MTIPFNKPYMTGRELDLIRQAYEKGHLSGDGSFTKQCHAWLEKHIGCKKALLTHSCTAALEMSAILADLSRGEEVIMPSYTFVSTANAFVLRGATPVFVDIRPDTLTLDESKIEAAITPFTRAIVPVHYAGVSCDMDAIMDIARNRGLIVIEDAAQGVVATYKDRELGSMGHMATVSFHETKNVISGEGGALLINDPAYIDRAEIIREKGTNRCRFFRGEVDKYSWVDIGSSYLPSDIIGAFLIAQLEEANELTNMRRKMWDAYHEGLKPLEAEGLLRCPILPPDCVHNAHMYYIILPTAEQRERLIAFLRIREIHAVTHYVPLHSSIAGMRYGRQSGDMTNTDSISQRILRLPLWTAISRAEVSVVVQSIIDFHSK